jgi:hypothetical protein
VVVVAVHKHKQLELVVQAVVAQVEPMILIMR